MNISQYLRARVITHDRYEEAYLVYKVLVTARAHNFHNPEILKVIDSEIARKRRHMERLGEVGRRLAGTRHEFGYMDRLGNDQSCKEDKA
jgi:hypothetical protein